MKYAFITELRKEHPVTALCRVLRVTESGYYASLKRPESKRSIENKRILSQVRIISAESKGAYGSIRIREELKSRGVFCGRHRVAKLMRENGIRAKAGKKYKATTKGGYKSRGGFVDRTTSPI